MAIQTIPLASICNGAVTWTVTYDDQTGLLQHLICSQNNTPNPTTLTATMDSNGRTASRTVQPGASLDIDFTQLPAGQRLTGFVDVARNRLDGISYTVTGGC